MFLPQSILVMPSSDSSSPCYAFDSNGKNKPTRLSADDIKNILLWAAKDETSVREVFFLAGADETLDSAVASILDGMGDQVIAPLLPLDKQKAMGIPFSPNQTVIACSLNDIIENAHNISGRPVILHVERHELGGLTEGLLLIQDHIGSISVRPRDIHLFNEGNFQTYEKQLSDIADISLMKQAAGTEGKFNLRNLNMLNRPSNRLSRCPAGTSFVVLTPDGYIYPCPAFYRAGNKYAIGSFRNMINNPAASNWNHRQCSFCGSIRCPGCPFLESSRLTGGENICRIYKAENHATEGLMSRVSRSGYLFDCLRTLKTRDCEIKSQQEVGESFGAAQQVHDATFDEFIQAIRDLRSAAEPAANKRAEDKKYDLLLKRWSELPEIPSASQRNVFRKRAYELLAELKKLGDLNLRPFPKKSRSLVRVSKAGSAKKRKRK
jgi:radical SAM protein with 4Fe4S-binding SPASM domain